MPTTSYSGTGWKKFDVPNDVEWVEVDLRGAGSNGRRGGRVTGRLSVSDKNTLYILLGQQGQAPSGDTGGATSTGGGGAGGNGTLGQGGGWGGGGATYIRVNGTSSDHPLRCVAAGAGGDSGDGGLGGRGGAVTGENGFPGPAGPFATANATGGTRTQGGEGGTSDAGTALWGLDGADTRVGRGGQGGSASTGGGSGGGGGGGGWYPGGGGCAESNTYAPGGGGAGGSNYTGGLIFATGNGTDDWGGGNAGNGTASITWISPNANQPPSPPKSPLRISGLDETDNLATMDRDRVTVSAIVSDPEQSKVRIVVYASTTTDFANRIGPFRGEWVDSGKRSSVTLTNLADNTHYYIRAYTQDRHGREPGRLSLSYNSANFWTDRVPVTELQFPVDNSQFSTDLNITFDWKFTDPDSEQATQKAYELRWRTAPTPNAPAGPWEPVESKGPSGYAGRVGMKTSFDKHTLSAGTFAGNTFYEWTVRTQDGQGLWGPWADPYSFYAYAPSTPPKYLSPTNGIAVYTDTPVTFNWTFLDPDPGDKQCKADVRYRVIGTESWNTELGSLTTPGSVSAWTFPGDTFVPGYEYEWQVRTYDGGPSCTVSNISEWSLSARFTATRTPGWAVDTDVVPELVDIQESLGCGVTRVFVYARGGERMIGEVTPITNMSWGRKRDDISNCLVSTNGFGPECGAMLGMLRCWMHELVVFRDGQRVWEGPITRLTYTANDVEIEAKDVMAYVYRRIMRQGYNDTFHKTSGEQLGQRTVVERALIITQNALAPDDPNVLPYLTAITTGEDAVQSRVVPDYSRTAWEEIDDLAATAGLDYVTVGRRIVYWDTHKEIGRLPEMRDNDFNQPPIVSEYGMQLANYFAVTNNNGIWGAVHATTTDPDDPEVVIEHATDFYGRIEQVASAYGETEGGENETVTAEDRAALETAMRGQADRNIRGRWPTPVVVRVPDNSTLNPEVNLSIQHLIPGVWIPLRATQTVRAVAQWQKLDEVNVVVEGDNEQVQVVMSPAPLGADVDLVQVAEE